METFHQTQVTNKLDNRLHKPDYFIKPLTMCLFELFKPGIHVSVFSVGEACKPLNPISDFFKNL